MAVTKEFAVKIDTELSALYDKRWSLRNELESAKDTKEFYEKHYPNRIEEIAKYENKIEVIAGKIREVYFEICKLDEIYDQDPWTRAFLG